jgi:hypothetical protein
MDLSFLSDYLRDAARLTDAGKEVMWPRQCAEDVINALADNGIVVLGLALRSDGHSFAPAGLATEVPWSAYRADRPGGINHVEEARADALEALRRPVLAEFDDYAWMLVTW